MAARLEVRRNLLDRLEPASDLVYPSPKLARSMSGS
jgi:hypothetical protein